jgi:hypothetical protein
MCMVYSNNFVICFQLISALHVWQFNSAKLKLFCLFWTVLLDYWQILPFTDLQTNIETVKNSFPRCHPPPGAATAPTSNCRIALFFALADFKLCYYCLNSSATNWGPLSETICSGIPNRANKFLSTSMLLAAVVDLIGITSGHLLFATTMHHQEHSILKRTSIINMYTLAWLSNPFSWG